MFEIRRITTEEMDDAIKLSEYSFKYKLKDEEREKKTSFMEDHIIFGVFDDQEMIAKTHVIPLYVLINNKEHTMGGIASVSTYPEYRRKGIVNRLINLSIETMKEEGHILSYLHPFDINFYRKYGYELISNLKKTTILNKDLSYYKGIEGKVERKKGLDGLSTVNEIYTKYITKYNGMLIRSEKWWRDNQYDGEHIPAIYYNEDNEPKGYLFYKIIENKMEVKEYIYLDEDSRRGLWNFIANHDSMIEEVEVITADDEQMAFLFNNPAAKIQLVPYFMARIVLVKEFLERYIDFSRLDRELVLGLKDQWATWNNGIYTISSNGVSFESVNKEALEDQLHKSKALYMDINTLTVIALGFQKPDFMYECRKISGDTNTLELLKSLLSKKYCSYLDYF
ncbi:GNAT family N-acetyltransferase [Alkaliphilus peptidifermentans]|uniref:Predicted acetyltransferase n=1 Tax=Alkaliphilus peptidifermentans DSM 18978 TaxID=1120976 RepID=A0A1G5J1C3_9FIRM|nr:GNAT family N-acetyltransferase [Alkaliphilus peptidifermentans]SCY81964.1 Predicted acetyltransferase [Alkaliphilus peptidifermentans DSM 18978]